MFRIKAKKEQDWVRCCQNCEWAKEPPEDDEYPETVYCTKCKKDKPADALCRHYVYDLLKRRPRRQAEIPTLDPDSIL